MDSIKAEALTQRELVRIKSRGAAAATTDQYEKRGRCHKEIRAVKNLMTLPQRERGSIKKWGCCRSEKWSV